jgi:hypothetical protein
MATDDIAHQQELLRINRCNLALYLQQRDLQGAAFVTPAIASGIVEARANIARIKGILRGAGVAVEDHPDDAAPPGPPAVPRPAPGGSVTITGGVVSGPVVGSNSGVITAGIPPGAVSDLRGPVTALGGARAGPADSGAPWLAEAARAIAGLPHGDQATQEALRRLTEHLATLLAQTPDTQQADAERALQRLAEALREAAQPMPDKEKVAWSLASLRQAAENIGREAPSVLAAAAAIADVIRPLAGLADER